MFSRVLSRIFPLSPKIHPNQKHTDVQLADSHISQALPCSSEECSSDPIPAKNDPQSENFDRDPIHFNTRCLSEYNQIASNNSAHTPDSEMRTHMSDAEMEDQQARGQVILVLDSINEA